MINFIATLFDLKDIEAYRQAGAGSVVVAVPFFSARGAALFEEQELKQIKQACVQAGLKMYVAVNRFFTEEELAKLEAFLRYLKALAVDGIYYGDECVLYLAEQLQMKDVLIYAPDTLLTNPYDAQYYLSQGISMVSISKEITLEEICEIARQVQEGIEITIHGRVNMMHSKRKLVSNYLQFIGKEEAIQGKKDLYIMEETRDEHMPIIEDELGTHVFSGYTLVSFEELKSFVEAGIKNFKIDGIFHDSAYVIEALSLYQAILKGADPQAILKQYEKAYEQDHVSNGFYYTKTSKVKVGE